MAKIKTHRAKHGKLWISVYLQDFGFGWNLGLNIYKSRRAQNDCTTAREIEELEGLHRHTGWLTSVA